MNMGTIQNYDHWPDYITKPTKRHHKNKKPQMDKEHLNWVISVQCY